MNNIYIEAIKNTKVSTSNTQVPSTHVIKKKHIRIVNDIFFLKNYLCAIVKCPHTFYLEKPGDTHPNSGTHSALEMQDFLTNNASVY